MSTSMLSFSLMASFTFVSADSGIPNTLMLFRLLWFSWYSILFPWSSTLFFISTISFSALTSFDFKDNKSPTSFCVNSRLALRDATESASLSAVTKSGTGTWDWGRGDSGTWGLGDVGTWGLGDVGTRALGDSGTWGLGVSGTWGRGDVGTHFYHLFNFSSYFTKSSSVDRSCVVPRLKSLVCMMWNRGLVNIYSIVYYSSS